MQNKSRIPGACLAFLMLLSNLAGCASQPAVPLETPPPATPSLLPSPTSPPTALPSDTPTPLPTLSEAILKNAAYRRLGFDQTQRLSAEMMQLTDGLFEAEQPGSGLPSLKVSYIQGAFGDLDGDGLEDAAVVLAADPGGSGTFYYLAPVLNRDGAPENPSNRWLGDRVAIRGLRIEAGHLLVEMLAHGPNDPQCCPSELVVNEYMLYQGQLLTLNEAAVAPLAEQAILALKSRDMASLAALIHPQRGVRFSPYSYVSEGDLLFPQGQVAGLFSDPQTYTWGAFDGSGEPISMTFAGYYERFVYSKDFASAQVVSFNHTIGTGNTIDNAADFYAGAVIVEYFLPGSEQYGGMDWQSLRLVFQEESGSWRLVGIIHGEWTI
jgi:hypothetical protein